MVEKRYEYMTVDKGPHHLMSDFTNRLNSYGSTGWRVVPQTYRMNQGAGSVMLEREKF